MFFVACSGFPVPVSRYWREFHSVEISDTEIAMPGSGTVRRWVREAPEGFAFTMIAPQQIAASGFRRTKENKALCESLLGLAKTLDAKAVVFAADESFKHGKAARTAVRSFLGFLPDEMPPAVLDLPAWKPTDIAATLGDRPGAAAYDPLLQDPPPPADLTYMRLPGPAGHRSRYDEASIQRIADHCAQIESSLAFCVFQNIDMQTNANQLMKKIR